MRVGLDYDDTVELDAPLFADLVRLFRAGGHEVIIVTFRGAVEGGNRDILAFAEDLGIDVVFTAGMQKAPYCDSILMPVDVWIDDSPVTIPSQTKLSGMAKGCLKSNDTALERDES